MDWDATKCVARPLPGVDHPEGPRLHAVDWPGSVALPVTDWYWESSIISPHKVDHRAQFTFQLKIWALTAVPSPPLWNWNKKIQIKVFWGFQLSNATPSVLVGLTLVKVIGYIKEVIKVEKKSVEKVWKGV